MSLSPIVKWPDPRLTAVCAPVAEGEDLSGLIANMLETMYDAPGRGLAAPQVGVLKRLFVMDVDWKDGARNPVVMVNPDILWRATETAEGEEGCLSIPGLTTLVTRPTEIRVRWYDAGNAVNEQCFDGFAARCIQHEYDHLDGRVTFDHLSPEMRHTAHQHYLSQKEANA
ncbi:Peptide deformylase [Tritonibacter mobilis]|uniref:peptide deformylase n=1 Tax=Tritonibacter mobilis TaxID=379347 RepID=UPI000F6F8570|nr:peptide deformylase [Tritonibacter mobilis]VCU59792.1 Peptide deformylase [Tritonibacter mobilis]